MRTTLEWPIRPVDFDDASPNEHERAVVVGAVTIDFADRCLLYGHRVEVVQHLLALVLASKHENLPVVLDHTVTVASTGHVALLLTLDPAQYFQLAPSLLQVQGVDNLATFVMLYLRLGQVHFLVQAYEHEGVREAVAALIDATMY